MSKEEKRVPEVRFEGFHDDWKQRKLGELVERVTRKNKNLDSTLPLTISAQDGLVDQNEYFTKIVASRNVSNYYLLKKGEFSYNKSYSNGYPLGAVKRLEKYEKGILSTLYVVFNPTYVNSDFLAKYYDSTHWYHEVYKHAAEGVRNHGLLNISPSDFFSTDLKVPKSYEEQSKIGIFINKLDNTIALHQEKLSKLQSLKKAALQSLFPKKYETEPRVRFTNFSSPWKQRKLGDLAVFNPKTSLPKKFEYVDLGSVVGTMLVSHRKEIKENAPSRAQRVAKKGDIFYQTVRPYQKNNYLYDLPYDNYVFSTGYAQLRPRINSYFLLNKLQEEKFVKDVLIRCTGTSYPAINSNDLANIKVKLPVVKQEREKIGVFFSSLEDSISLHQQKLEKLQNCKKSFLQKMFI